MKPKPRRPAGIYARTLTKDVRATRSKSIADSMAVMSSRGDPRSGGEGRPVKRILHSSQKCGKRVEAGPGGQTDVIQGHQLEKSVYSPRHQCETHAGSHSPTVGSPCCSRPKGRTRCADREKTSQLTRFQFRS